MTKGTLYSLTAGNYTVIPATRVARRVEIAEDGTGNNTGLAIKLPDDNFTAVLSYPPAQQPIVLGNVVANQNGAGMFLGLPTQTGLNARTADTYCLLSCMSGTTIVRVTELD